MLRIVTPLQGPKGARPLSLSLFSGAMGLDLGLEAAGFRIAFANDVMPAAGATIAANRPSVPFFQGDIRELQGHSIRQMAGIGESEIDLLAGGPPCQSFSTAGNRKSISDERRGSLVFEFVRLVDELRPRAFVMENVKGLLSASVKERQLPYNNNGMIIDEWHGSVLRELLRRFSAIGYTVDFAELNAADFGVPQTRRRVFFVGARGGLMPKLPTPTHSRRPGLLSPPWRTLFNAIGDLAGDCSPRVAFSARKRQVLDRIPPGGNWRDLPPDQQKATMGRAYLAKGGRSGHWRRLAWTAPSPTILTEPQNASTSLCHPDETRPLSVRECARIQTFPDDWSFQGTTREQYALVGNAVPVLLAKAIGLAVQEMLKGEPQPLPYSPVDTAYQNRSTGRAAQTKLARAQRVCSLAAEDQKPSTLF